MSKTKKIMVNIDADLKQQFTDGCDERLLNASAVIRHLISLQIENWEKTGSTTIQKIHS